MIRIEFNIDQTFFPRVLKAKRLQTGLSQADYAKQLQCTESQLRAAESGEALLPEAVVEHFLNSHSFYNLTKLCLMASSQGIGLMKVKQTVGPRVYKQVKELFAETEYSALD